MAIKLKNMTNKTKAVLLICLAAAAMAAVRTGMQVVNRWYWGNWYSNRINMIFAIITLSVLALGVYLLFYLYPVRTWKEMKKWKLDFISVEVVAAVFVFISWIWYTAFRSCAFDSQLFYLIGIPGIKSIVVVSILVFLPLAALDIGCIILIIRRVLQGTVKKTSTIYGVIQRRKNVMPIEQLIRIKERTAFIIMTVCLAGTIFLMWYAMSFWLNSLVLFIVPLAIISYICFIKTYRKNKIYKDMGYLLNQIQSMADGELNAPGIEDDSSLLYEGSQNLCAISTNLKRTLEKQMQSERMKIDLITNVSHDLKTPLTSMIGYIDLLKKEELSDEAKDYVEVLSVKHEQLKNMIQDIFDLSKATSGEVQLELEELDMKKLLEQTMGDMEDAVKKSGMIIREKVEDKNLKIIGDGKKLYRVLQNIISNALKYSLKGTRIFIEAGHKKERIYVSIKNTASYEMDFTPEEIMERFARADKSRGTEGYGLGLAIAESFTKSMGGEFKIEIDGDQFKVQVEFEGLS